MDLRPDLSADLGTDDLGGPQFRDESGYDAAEVDAFVARANDQLTYLEQGWREADDRARRAEDGYVALVKLLTLVQEAAESTISAARVAADLVRAEAQRQADEIVDQARAEAARAMEQPQPAIEADLSAYEPRRGRAPSQRSG
jgi:hypothetical protein